MDMPMQMAMLRETDMPLQLDDTAKEWTCKHCLATAVVYGRQDQRALMQSATHQSLDKCAQSHQQILFTIKLILTFSE